MIFQDPLASLKPRMTIGGIIAEPLRTYHPKMSRQEVRERVKAMMLKVGLLPNLINAIRMSSLVGSASVSGLRVLLFLN